jgi:hypothetical protein
MTPGVKQGGHRFSGVGPSEYQYQDDESVMLTEQIYNLNKQENDMSDIPKKMK